MNFCTKNDVIALFRALSVAESAKVDVLIPIVSDQLRIEAKNRNRDLDEMIAETPELSTVAKSVAVNMISRALMTPTDAQPMSQFSESAMGFTVSGTYLNPGQFVKPLNSELKSLGIIRQKVGFINMMGDDDG